MTRDRFTSRRPWALALSDRVYSALLLAFPARFRQEYGAEVAQVFRACCREAFERGGTAAVARLWLRSLGDLGVAVVSEHIRGGSTMSRSMLIRVSSLAAIAGGILWLAYVLLWYGSGVVGRFIGGDPMWNTDWLTAVYFFGAPSLWLLFGIALAGLHLRMAITPRWLGVILLAISLVGVSALLIGNLGMNYIWSLNSGKMVIDLSAPQPAIMQFDTQLYTAAFAGYLVLGCGMVLIGVVAVARHALPRHNTLVLAMGMLVGLQYFFTDMGAPSLLRNTGTPGLLVMMGESLAFLLVWSIGWILIGRLLRSESSPEVAQAAEVQALPSA